MEEKKACVALGEITQKLLEVVEVMEPGTFQRLRSPQPTIAELVELLDWLRTTLKYSKFDIEACRREMRSLRKYIDEQKKRE